MLCCIVCMYESECVPTKRMVRKMRKKMINHRVSGRDRNKNNFHLLLVLLRPRLLLLLLLLLRVPCACVSVEIIQIINSENEVLYRYSALRTSSLPHIHTRAQAHRRRSMFNVHSFHVVHEVFTTQTSIFYALFDERHTN